MWHLAKVSASYFMATLATGNFSDFVVRALWFLEEGEGHTQSHTKPAVHTTRSILCLLITPPTHTHTRSYLHSPVSQVTGLHSLAFIQRLILNIARFEHVQWFITKLWRWNQAGFCFILGTGQPISRIFRRRANLFPPFHQCLPALERAKTLKC